MPSKVPHFIAMILLLIFLSGCNTVRNMSYQQKGVAVGSGTGAIIGGMIGNTTENTALGAILGSVVGGITGGVIGDKMDRKAERIKNEIPGVEIKRVGEGINITFDEKSSIYFDFGQATLNETSTRLLEKLGHIFKEDPNTDILIEGHTDDVGRDAFNMELSRQRAQAVETHFVKSGISRSRLTTQWYGKTQPKYPNDTPAHRAKNRRVELAITANEKMKEVLKKQAYR